MGSHFSTIYGIISLIQSPCGWGGEEGAAGLNTNWLCSRKGACMAQARKRQQASDPIKGGLSVAACALVGAFVGITMDNLLVGIVLGCVFGVAVSMAKRR